MAQETKVELEEENNLRNALNKAKRERDLFFDDPRWPTRGRRMEEPLESVPFDGSRAIELAAPPASAGPQQGAAALAQPNIGGGQPRFARLHLQGGGNMPPTD